VIEISREIGREKRWIRLKRGLSCLTNEIRDDNERINDSRRRYDFPFTSFNFVTALRVRKSASV
jgi:hypothetical protein